MSLAMSLFLLVFIAELVQWIGQSVLLDLAYGLYLQLFNRRLAKRQRTLKSEILATKAELMKTSAQDQFATWAKLKRKVDKGLVDLEKLNGEAGSARASFSVKFNVFMWIITTGLQFVIGWWYRKAAVFYLPPGWLGPATWWLALPFAPAGSVSCGVWQMACKRVIKVGERLVKDFASSSSKTAPVGGKQKPEKAKAQ